VDEYQDTNRPQYELMKLLAGERKNVCAVGDEDQSIYSWRGADIRNILEFEKDFPNARIVRLEQNYRSTQVILEAAGAVVANNLRRKGKKLWTDRQGGSLIGYYEAPDGENEASFIADRIQKFLREADSRNETRRRRIAPCSTAPTPSRGWWRRRCAATTSLHHGRRLQLLRARRDQGPARLPAPGPQPPRLDGPAAGHQHPVRGIGKTTLETLERLALETGQSTWEALGAAIANRLIPTRA
jgi:DNA helicase-2/ATP-dependent DNA helicase PcrA